MTAEPVPSPDTPHEVLAGLKDLTRKVRAAQRGAWFPLLLLGLLLLGGIIVNRLTFHVSTAPCPRSAAPDCVLAKQGSPLYWTLGLAIVYGATAVFYLRRSRERGVGSTIRPYVIAGIVIVALIAPARFWDAGQTTAPGASVDVWGLHFHPGRGTEAFLSRLTGRSMSIGLPLLVLSWVERNRAVLLFTLGYLVIELIPVTVGTANVAPVSPWSSVPHLATPAVFLLLGALGFGRAQHARQTRRAQPAQPARSGGPA